MAATLTHGLEQLGWQNRGPWKWKFNFQGDQVTMDLKTKTPPPSKKQSTTSVKRIEQRNGSSSCARNAETPKKSEMRENMIIPAKQATS